MRSNTRKAEHLVARIVRARATLAKSEQALRDYEAETLNVVASHKQELADRETERRRLGTEQSAALSARSIADAELQSYIADRAK